MNLKFLWGLMLSILIAGVLYLSLVGLPSPSVEVRKKIPVPNLNDPAPRR